MNILLTNDDGIYAPGLWALYKALSDQHAVTVIAPDRERSAVGHGITLSAPIRAEWICVNNAHSGYGVSGTPVDCIKLGILELLKGPPDMVVSGINAGENAGVNINYSGTVAAAKEATLYGIPSLSVSMTGHAPAHYDEAAVFIAGLAETVMQKGLPAGSFLNVNYPDMPSANVAGICINRQATDMLEEYFEKRVDPRNRSYYWHGAVSGNFLIDPQTDAYAVSNQYISITPIKCDMTDFDLFDDLNKWEISLS